MKKFTLTTALLGACLVSTPLFAETTTLTIHPICKTDETGRGAGCPIIRLTVEAGGGERLGSYLFDPPYIRKGRSDISIPIENVQKGGTISVFVQAGYDEPSYTCSTPQGKTTLELKDIENPAIWVTINSYDQTIDYSCSMKDYF